ncbi:MAG: hypothetical protein U0T36_09850 [Saprospiraceae bacterium]|jgi:hypothetical protein
MKHIVWSLVVMAVISCKEDKDAFTIKNEKIRHAVEARKVEYRKEILGICQRDVYEQAKIYVDSLIAAEINFQLSDSIVFPPKPIKPPSPGPIIVPDTIKAKPVF